MGAVGLKVSYFCLAYLYSVRTWESIIQSHIYVIQQELENENRELRMSLDKYKVLFNRQDSTPGK